MQIQVSRYHDLISWLQQAVGITAYGCPVMYYCMVRCRYPIEVRYLWPPLAEAFFDHNVGHRQDGEHRCNLVLATVKGVKEPKAVITDEPPPYKRCGNTVCGLR